MAVLPSRKYTGGSRRVVLAACALVSACLVTCSGCRDQGPSREPARHRATWEDAMDRLRHVPPDKILFTEGARIPLSFREPGTITTGPGDGVYVTGETGVLIFDHRGRQTGKVETATPVEGIAVDEDRTMYVGMGDHVEVYSAGLSRQSAWPALDESAIITSIALDQDVFVGDYGNRLVWRCDRRGTVLGQIGGGGATAGDTRLILCPCISALDVALDPDGAIWLSDHKNFQVRRYSRDGQLLGAWGHRGDGLEAFCGACNPTHIAISQTGELFTSERTVERVKVYTLDGELLGVAASPASFPTKVVGLDLAVDSTGRLLVLDPEAKAVRVFQRHYPVGSEPEPAREAQ